MFNRYCMLVLLGSSVLAQATGREARGVRVLKDGWRIQASARAQEGGDTLSRPGHGTAGWIACTVPSTVMGALVQGGQYPDVFLGRNLERIDREPFLGSWWYRTEFILPSGTSGPTRLQLDGINYRANLWLNGQKVADAETLKGAFRRFEVEVTAFLRPGANALAIEVFPPRPGDFTLGFVDWNPLPPDRNMGLFREVRLRTTGSVSVEDLAVDSKVDLVTLGSADLTVALDLVNRGTTAARGTLRGALGSTRFRVPFALAPGERRALKLTPREVKGLHLVKPRLWWPLHHGEPHLYTLKVEAWVGASPSDGRSLDFGVREVGDYVNAQGHRGYTVNGRKILIRGGGWVDDLFLREDPRNLRAQLEYVRHMNLNTLRLEGFWGASDALYELADRMGILIMAGWSCQWEWPEYLGKALVEHDKLGGPKDPADVDLVCAYLRDHVRWLRHHPSLLVWVLGSDKLPWPEVERRYRADLQVLDPHRPVLATCKGLTSEVSGPSGVKMAGPYQYVTPNYWFLDTQHGGAFGFNTETGPGPQVPPLNSLEAMLPPESRWPINEVWNYHCGRFSFGNLEVYLKAFKARYGASTSLEEFAFKAQAANLEAMRAMFEAFGAHKPATTGVVAWMLNAAWPKLYWQLYGHDLMPNGAFYGARKGSMPLHALYHPGDHTVRLVNDTPQALDGARLRVRIFDPNSREVFAKVLTVNCAANEAAKVLDLPPLDTAEPLHFLSLALVDAKEQALSDNVYWLSSQPDVLDLAKTEWHVTPNAQYADFRVLGTLPLARVGMKTTFRPGKRWEAVVTLTNAGPHLAFFNELTLVDGRGKPVLPVLWEDNYLTLLPGEVRTVKARFAQEDLPAGKPQVRLKGWNLAPE